MRAGTCGIFLSLLLIVHSQGLAQSADAGNAHISLAVPAGTPLRLYVTKRFAKRTGAPVSAKVLEPIYAFDRQVIPAGTIVTGSVSRTQPVSKWERVQAIVRGDFTPLRISEVEFHSLALPGSQTLTVSTVETSGLNSIYVEPKKRKSNKPQNPNTGVLGTARQTLQDRLNAQVDGRTQGIAGVLRSPNKKERFYDLAMGKLPYHPQYVRRGTRFDAELRESVSFGSESITLATLAKLGTQPPDTLVSARLLTPLDSASARQGDAISAVLTEPLYGPGHTLVLPQGTQLKGSVVTARRARWFHRTGRLRFNFLSVELPPEVMGLREERTSEIRTQGILQAAEGSGGAIQMDSEGGVKATEPKTRLFARWFPSWLPAARRTMTRAGPARALPTPPAAT